jgi:hypothetical protein
MSADSGSNVTNVTIDPALSNTIGDIFIGIGDVFIFLFYAIWTLLVYLMARGINNKTFYIIVLAFFGYCLFSNFIYLVTYLSKGSAYTPTLAALIPEAFATYMTYKAYSALAPMRGGRRF